MQMIKKEILKKFDKIIFIIIIICCSFFVIFQKYNKTLLGILLLCINTYMIIKYRKHKLLFLAMLIMCYFNYSFIITRYIGTPSSLLDNLYNQLVNSNTLYISIIMQIFFLCIINLIIGEPEPKENVKYISTKKFKYRKILILALQIMLVLILMYHLLKGITCNTPLFEYSIFLFIFAFYYSKDDKKNKIITEIILFFFTIYSLKNGDRIAVLQFLLVDFIINYLYKFKAKNIVISLVIGIFIFTFAGLYGDFLDYGYDFKNLTVKFVMEKFNERRMALDTSVSAYFSGISMVDVSNKFSKEYRINNAKEYFTKYTLFGAKVDYKTVDLEIRKFQVNYGGGLPTCYFYFWLGWLGVIVISIYVGILLRTVNKSVKLNSKDYTKMLSIFIVSTIPRWYLYVPTLLFRGVAIFSIIYAIIYFLFLKDIKRNNTIERKD